MENNKLITLLKTLSKEEFRLFARFVRSPLHNRHEGVIRLFTYLREQIEGRKGPVQQEKVMARLFPDQPEDVQQLHYLSSYLLKVAEEFLAWAEWKNDQTEQDGEASSLGRDREEGGDGGRCALVNIG